MLKKIATSMLSVSLVAGAALASVQSAEARGGRVAAGVAAGIIGLGILGAYANARERTSSEAIAIGGKAIATSIAMATRSAAAATKSASRSARSATETAGRHGHLRWAVPRRRLLPYAGDRDPSRDRRPVTAPHRSYLLAWL